MNGFIDFVRQIATRLQARGLGVAARFVLTGAVIFLLSSGRFWIALGSIIAVYLVSVAITEKPRLERGLNLFFSIGVPFGFTLWNPGNALAGMFVVFAFGAAHAFDSEDRIFLVERSIVFLLFAIACAAPDYFSLISYGLGIIVFALAGWRYTALRDAP